MEDLIFDFSACDPYCAKERQDAFAHNLIGNDGFFYDFGCEWADGSRNIADGIKQGNNTLALERNFNWSGILFDINQFGGACGRSKSKFFRIDLSQEIDRLKEILNENTPTKTVDYVSIDTAANATTPPIQAMFDCDIEFKVMTLEHDLYGGHIDQQLIRKESRQLLSDNNYLLLFGDVCLADGSPWEDWWVNPKFFNKDITSLKEDSIYFEDCIRKLRSV